MLKRTLTQPLETPGSLAQLYTFKRPHEVIEYLDKYPFLVPILYESYFQTRKYFPGVELLLEVVADAEVDDWVTLFVEIVPKDEPEVALERLHQFNEKWWLETVDQAEGKLAITLEYQ